METFSYKSLPHPLFIYLHFLLSFLYSLISFRAWRFAELQSLFSSMLTSGEMLEMERGEEKRRVEEKVQSSWRKRKVHVHEEHIETNSVVSNKCSTMRQAPATKRKSWSINCAKTCVYSEIVWQKFLRLLSTLQGSTERDPWMWVLLWRRVAKNDD